MINALLLSIFKYQVIIRSIVSFGDTFILITDKYVRAGVKIWCRAETTLFVRVNNVKHVLSFLLLNHLDTFRQLVIRSSSRFRTVQQIFFYTAAGSDC